MSWISRLHHLLRQFGDKENVSKGQHSDDFVQLYVDRLEERRVLSVTAALADGVLTIAGDGDADSVEVRLIDAGEDGSGANEEFIQILNNGTVVDISVMGSVPTIESQIATSQLHGNSGTQAGLQIDLGDGADDLSLQIPTGVSFGGDTLSVLVTDDAQDDTLTLVDNGLDVDAELATNVSVTAEAGTIQFGDDDFNLGAVDLDLTGTLQLTTNQMLTSDGNFTLVGSVSQAAIGAPYDFNINLGENDLDISGDVGTIADRLGAVQFTAETVSVGSLFAASLTVDLADDIGTFTTTTGDLNVTDALSAEGSFSLNGSLDVGSLTLTGDTTFDAVGMSRSFDVGSITGVGFELELTSFDEVEFSDDATGLGALTINAGSDISLRDVTTNGLQSYTAANIITNSDYDTNGANFVMVGNWDVQTSSSVITDGGDIDLSAAVLYSFNANVGLTLNSSDSILPVMNGNVLLGEASIPGGSGGQLLHDVTVQSAEDVTFSGSPFSLAGAFTQSAGTGTTTLAGMIGVASLTATTANIAVAGGTQVASAAEITLTSTSNSLVFSGTSELKANDGDGSINITGNVTGDANDNAEITFNGTTTIDGNIVGTAGSGIEQLNIQGGNLSVGSLNIDGGMTVDSGSEVEADDGDIIVGGTATLGGNVTASADGAQLTIAAGVILTDSVTLTGETINVTGDIEASGGMGMPNVTVFGTTDVSGSIGSGVGNLTVDGGTLTTGGIHIMGNLIVEAHPTDDTMDVLITDTNGISVDGDLVARGIINSAAAIDIGGVSSVGANITTNGTQTFGGAMTLTDDVTL
ncbi:FapA family protein, partial [Planctomicrobium sp.]|nr:FapA family protein [Planctomicrobium sp.]